MRKRVGRKIERKKEEKHHTTGKQRHNQLYKKE
jgi:hypothetical protein